MLSRLSLCYISAVINRDYILTIYRLLTNVTELFQWAF